MKVKTGDLHLFRLIGGFHQLQDANALPDNFGADPAGLAGEENLFQPFVPERTDHLHTVDYLVYYVNFFLRELSYIRSNALSSSVIAITKWSSRC
jgi:hypothetical protein